MRVYKTFTPEPKAFERLTSIKCDLCGKPATDLDWDCGQYRINETEINITIKQKEGYNYPETGAGTKHDIDICPDCFKSKLVPWFKSQGADIKETEWDW